MNIYFLIKARHKKIILIAGLIFSFSQLIAQDKNPSDIRNQFVRYNQHALMEKIFVHTNKNFYLAGEILWMKLYDVDASFHKPLDISKVAYVEIIDKNNKPVIQGKIFLKKGSGNGSFYLPLNINSGNYKLRAYSNWMKNYSVDFFFEKTIAIVNSKKPMEHDASAKLLPPDIRFFPEGGNLVYNIASKVAFKIVGSDGKGIDCDGSVVNENKDTVVRFHTLKFGMGNFNFTPLVNHSYQAVLKMPSSELINVPLPEIYKEGYVLSITNAQNNQLAIDVETNLSSAGDVYLLAHNRQSVKAASGMAFQNGHAVFLVDKEKLGDGIVHFTVFNNRQQPVCERLYFSYPKEKLQIEASTNSADYATRKKIDVLINATNENAKEEMADMSMSIYRLDSLQTIEENQIQSYLLLTSDLAGNIESPDYYFAHPPNETKDAIDNLMLTQGWRRFKWNDVLQNDKHFFEFPPECNGHIITGKVVDIRTSAPAKYMMSYLSVPSTRTLFSTSLSDSNGIVKFEMRKMLGSSEIVVQTNSREDSTYRVDIVNPFSEKYTDKFLPSLKLGEAYKDIIIDQNVSMQVQNIYLSEKLRRFEDISVDTNAFYQKLVTSYLLDNYTRFTTLEEVLREYVSSISVKIKKGQFHLPVIDGRRREFFEDDPLVLLDGVPVFNIDKMMAYDPLKIRKLDVLNDRYYLGSSFIDGIISFTTYNGNLNGFDLDPHAVVIDYEGMQLQREFYSPVYDTEEKRASSIPDFRNVLYWSPDVKTDATGKKQISFYSSDLSGKYAIVLQGITADGRSGSKVITFEVKE
jgi:hypothetical protein